VEGTGKVNELIQTSEEVDVFVQRVVRKCQVVKVSEGQEIPQLANRSGSCDWFFYRDERNKLDGVKIVDEVSAIVPANEDQVEISKSSTASTSPEDMRSTPIEIELDKGLKVPPIEAENSATPLGLDLENSASLPKLRGLDLFCGGGNFGRGVADGGAVDHKWYLFY
jgi:hypothetical protein